MKEIKNLINSQSVLVDDPEKVAPVTPCMDVYKTKIQSNGSLDQLNLIIVVREDLQNKPTDYMTILKHVLTDAVKHKTRLHQLDLSGHSYRHRWNLPVLCYHEIMII